MFHRIFIVCYRLLFAKIRKNMESDRNLHKLFLFVIFFVNISVRLPFFCVKLKTLRFSRRAEVTTKVYIYQENGDRVPKFQFHYHLIGLMVYPFPPPYSPSLSNICISPFSTRKYSPKVLSIS